MRAIVLPSPRAAIELRDVKEPVPARGEILLRVEACAICRTDLHVIDGELPALGRAIVLGHQVVGVVVARGEGAHKFEVGARVGVPWLGGACGACARCRRGRENLCAEARFTGYHLDGGLAESCVADERFVFAIPKRFASEDAAPLLCAGLIGYRTLRMAGDDAARIGIYGFGSAGHLVAQVARHEGREVFAFTRPGDVRGQAFARSLGAAWAGGSDERPPVELDAALLFAPLGELVPRALEAVAPGGVVVCGGIHMSDLPSMPYHLLWGERVLRSVANLTRADGEAFLALAARMDLRTTVHPYPLEAAGAALDDLRRGRFEGAAVIVPAERED
jgi:propanol-preferring alcohol dehydrogenase